MKQLKIILVVIFLVSQNIFAAETRLQNAWTRHASEIQKDLSQRHLTLGSPVYLRVFKKPRHEPDGADRDNYREAQVEVWIKNNQDTYQLFKTYYVCTFSGALGPKLKVKDWQLPEGFYSLSPTRINPNSTYYISMDIGYPNAFDRAHGSTGDKIMIHGRCKSIGCLAMGVYGSNDDSNIEEIYVLVSAAWNAGYTSIPIHIFPFPMTEQNFSFYPSRWENFWRQLKPAYDYFERNKKLPSISVVHGDYQIEYGKL